MKTAEELLKEKGITPETVHHNYAYVYRTVCDIIGEAQSEAMRWRDPKEELPENVGLYLCKCEKELGYYFEIVFFNKVWRSDKVIGWKPIE